MATDRPIDIFLSRLDGKRGRGKYTRCRCPLGDHSQKDSLSVWEKDDGGVGFKCHYNCDKDQILAQMGLTWADTYVRQREKSYRQTKSFPIEKDKSGKVTKWGEAKLVRADAYTDEDGNLLYEECKWTSDERPKSFSLRRFWPNKHEIEGLVAGWYAPGEGKRRFKWKLVSENGPELKPAREDGSPILGAVYLPEVRWVLYRLREVLSAVGAGDRVWLVEGPKDADRLRREGETATTHAKGAAGWRDEYALQLKGAAELVVVLDWDKAGLERGIELGSALWETEAPIVRFVRAKVGKDATDHLEAGCGIADFVPVSAIELEVAYAAMVAEKAKNPPSDPPPPEEREPEPPDPEWPPKKWPRTDVDNAELMHLHHGRDLRFCAKFGAYLVWTGRHWAEDETDGAPVSQRWVSLARELGKAAWDIEGDDEKKAEAQRKAVLLHVDRALSSGGISAMETRLRHMPGMPVVPDDFDKWPELLPVRNGVVDLRTGRLRPHDRRLLNTKYVDVVFNPEADCPTFAEFLRRVTGRDGDLARLMRKAAGYSATGLTTEQKFFYLYGPASSGKTTFLEIMRWLMGAYAQVLEPDHLMERRTPVAIPEHLAVLRGARLVAATEVRGKDKFDEGLMKRITGGEGLQVRRLHGKTFELKPEFKIWVTGNDRVRVDDQGNSFWRRMVPLPFEQVIPKDEIIGDFFVRLKAEASGILNWVVAGAQAWFGEGLGTAAAVEAAKDEYRQEVDRLGWFLRECTEAQPGNFITTDALHKAYTQWARAAGLEFKLDKIELGRRLRQRGDMVPKKGTKANGFADIGLLLEWQPTSGGDGG